MAINESLHRPFRFQCPSSRTHAGRPHLKKSFVGWVTDEPRNSLHFSTIGGAERFCIPQVVIETARIGLAANVQ